jgi:EpsI family protein
MPPQFIAAAVVLAVTVSAAQAVNFQEKVPLVKSFASFPLQVGEWSGTRTAMEQQFLEALNLTDYVIVNYRNSRNKDANFYVAYNDSQRKGESTHSPSTCLPSNGWVFQESGTTDIPLQGEKGAAMRVNRAFMEKNGVKQLVYYWFPQRGRILHNLVQIKIYNFLDAVTRQRTDGALVRVITPIYDSEPLADAEARLQQFTREITPVLAQFIPR